MTMHLVRGMTTINTKKRKAKGITAADRKAQAEHDKWLTKMGVHPDQLAEKKKANGGKSSHSCPTTVPSVVIKSLVILANRGNGTKKEGNTYSGERQLLGVAMMHKSNPVPVFSTKDAKEIARMRRG